MVIPHGVASNNAAWTGRSWSYPSAWRAAIHLMGSVVPLDGLSPAPTAQHVIDRAGILHSHRARHGTSLAETGPTVKRDGGMGRPKPTYRFDPFLEGKGTTVMVMVAVS